MKKTIGIIGFGNMGSAIVRRIADSGIISVYETDKGKQKIVTSISNVKAASDNKKLALWFNAGPVGSLSLDPERFRQIITNLIGNAIKYTPRGEVKVETKKDNKKVIIRISDTGIGLTAEEQKNLFKKFYRVRTEETKEIKGTGLGLWISSEIIKNMKGGISVESIKGTGSHFILSFPA